MLSDERREMTKMEQLDQQVRDSAPLHERLDNCRKIIGNLCSKGRIPKMSIPVRWDDEDHFMSVTIKDAADEITSLRTALRQIAGGWYEDAEDCKQIAERALTAKGGRE